MLKTNGNLKDLILNFSPRCLPLFRISLRVRWVSLRTPLPRLHSHPSLQAPFERWWLPLPQAPTGPRPRISSCAWWPQQGPYSLSQSSVGQCPGTRSKPSAPETDDSVSTIQMIQLVRYR